MDVTATVWVVFVAIVLALLAVDFFLFGRRGITFRSSLWWSIGWFALGVGVTLVIGLLGDRTAAEEYLAGYLIERSLSIDNIFVFALIFGYFAVPLAEQGRLLSIGILMALVLRAGFIVAGAALLDAFHFTIYLFGGLLVVTGIRLATHRDHEVHPDRNPVVRLLRHVWPGATITAAVVVTLATTDIIFAIDSIPAIFAVTDDTFIVFAANAFALLGLRSLYFLLAGMMERFTYLNLGLALVLVWVGSKMLLTDVWKVPTWLSLVVIVLILTVSIAASFLRTRPGGPGDGGDAHPSGEGGSTGTPPVRRDGHPADVTATEGAAR
jgi:tellurite resistance protein TerC